MAKSANTVNIVINNHGRDRILAQPTQAQIKEGKIRRKLERELEERELRELIKDDLAN